MAFRLEPLFFRSLAGACRFSLLWRDGCFANELDQPVDRILPVLLLGSITFRDLLIVEVQTWC